MNVPIACNLDSGGAVCRLLPPRGVLPPRGGLTLIEILMTIFVLAIGLLGVAALLPVGTFQMRQGQIAQQSAEVGSRALDTIEASEINHPGRWARLGAFPNFDAVDISNPDHPVRIACPVTSASVTLPPDPYPPPPPDPPDPPDPATLMVNTASPPAAPDNFQNSLIGFARCQKPTVWGTQWRITDGIFTANYLGELPSYATALEEDVVEDSLTPDLDDVFVIKRYEPFAIDPLYVAAQGAAPVFAPNVERLTLFGVGTSSTMGLAAAEAVFESTDELQFTPGREGDSASSSEDESKLPEQLAWQSSGSAAKRQSQGEYSWLATFVPVEPAGPTSFPHPPPLPGSGDPNIPNIPFESNNYQDCRTYTVSVAVFYKRPLQLLSTVSERTLTLAHNSGSTFTISGTTFENQDSTESPTTFDPDDGDESYIKSGQWGLVTVVARDASTGREWVERARWYRLGSVGKPDATSGDVKARLIGPDWTFENDTLTNDPPQKKETWEAPPDGLDDNNEGITYTYQITFYEGLVAVFERTMRVPELPIGEAP